MRSLRMLGGLATVFILASAVLSRWATEQGGFDVELLALATAIALRGNATAQYVVGVADKYPEWRRPGSRIEQDSAQAHSWLLRAAEQGNPYAAGEVGDNLLRGDGVAQNEEEALLWFETAAEGGHVRAQYLAGYIYLKRYYETSDPEDEEMGREWMELEAEDGDEDTIRLLNELDGIEAAYQKYLDSKEEPSSESRQENRKWALEPVETE